jgi:hypothetical protein
MVRVANTQDRLAQTELPVARDRRPLDAPQRLDLIQPVCAPGIFENHVSIAAQTDDGVLRRYERVVEYHVTAVPTPNGRRQLVDALPLRDMAPFVEHFNEDQSFHEIASR